MTAEPSAAARAATVRVLAVVVSYRAGHRIAETIWALADQVGQILVVDNGSDAHTLETLRALHACGQISLEELGTNRGLGFALNVGARHAIERGFQWLLTMDQDSIADSSMVAAMLDLTLRNPWVRCVSPNLVIHGRAPAAIKSGPVAYAITSGNLLHLDVWKAAGPFNEDYFIDCIDFDFSLRARQRGFAIHKAAQALLHHELGQYVAVRRRFEGFYTQHSPIRRYYMFRNFLYLARAHALREPRFIGKLFVSHLLLLALLLVYEPMLKKNLVYIGRGLLDFMRGRRGAYVGDGSC
jgi:rhamnosyltransferase